MQQEISTSEKKKKYYQKHKDRLKAKARADHAKRRADPELREADRIRHNENQRKRRALESPGKKEKESAKTSIRQKAYYQKNKERIKKQVKVRRVTRTADPELRKLDNATHNESRRRRKAARTPEEILRDREADRLQKRDYVQRNPEKVKAFPSRSKGRRNESARQFRAKVKADPVKAPLYKERERADNEKRKEWRHAYDVTRWANEPEYRKSRLAQAREWRRNNADYMAAHRARRRAMEMNAPGYHSKADIKARWDKQGHKCAVPNCPHPIAASGPHRYHVDHIQALINGGSNWPDNLQILCRYCNIAKRDMDEYEWAQRELGMLFVK